MGGETLRELVGMRKLGGDPFQWKLPRCNGWGMTMMERESPKKSLIESGTLDGGSMRISCLYLR